MSTGPNRRPSTQRSSHPDPNPDPGAAIQRGSARAHWRALALPAAGSILLLTLGLPMTGAPSLEPASRPGPALRSGLKALDAGANDTAARMFGRVREQHPIIADHAAHWEAEALLRSGQLAEAAGRVAATTAEESRGPLAGALARIEAEARSRLGELEAGRAAWRRAAGLERENEERAELLAQVAGSYEAEGNGPAARDVWLEIWAELPETPRGTESVAALDRLDSGSPPRRSEAELLRTRCDAWTDARRNEPALEDCAAARDRAPNAREARELDQRRADLLFRLRRYPEARRAYAALPGRKARFRAARSLARSGHVPESILEFEALGEGRDALAARARFLAGTLWEDRDAERANAHYRAVARKAPLASQRLEASWRLGWGGYRAGRYAEAEELLRGVASNASDPLEALRGRYWSAQAAVRAGDAGGTERLIEIAREFPFTYYGWRAATVLLPGSATLAPGPEPEALATVSRLPGRTLERARILIEAGLPEDAARELAGIRKLARTRADRLMLASLLQDSQDHHRAQRLILDVYLLDLARGPRGTTAELWWSAYPDAYASHVESAVEQRAVDAALVYAVMREESGYRPKVLSVVGARGLAQIMPETGRRLAAQLGDPGFHPDDLFVPARNLDLAAHYLESLLRRFDGRTSAAVASYNAGPSAVAGWLAADGSLRDDEWVEEIPYDQTRAYVKRVLRSVYAYEVLY